MYLITTLLISVPGNFLITGALFLLSCTTAFGATEGVLVKKVINDNAIVVRSNGDTYLIEKGVGCLSLWRYEGKTVYVSSPGLFLGVGARLLIPDADQECAIWKSDLIGSGSARPPSQPPSAAVSPVSAAEAVAFITAIQKALSILGYDAPVTGFLDDKTLSAMSRYAIAKNHPSTEVGIRLSLMSLAVDVLDKRPASPESLTIADQIYRFVKRSEGTQPNRDCIDGHWISSVMGSGKLIKLEDDSIWEVDTIDTINSMLWLPTEEVLLCGQTMINTENGEKVNAKPLR